MTSAPSTDVEPVWTPRQREVLDLLVRGRSNAEIAATLGVSLDGAKWHMREILQKLGVDSREDAAEYWRRHNGLRPRLWRTAHAAFTVPVWAKWVVGAGAAVVTVVAAVALAWPGTADAPGATPTAVATGTAIAGAPFPGLYPHGTTTGIDIVDRVVSAVIGGSATEIAPLLDYTEVACVDGSDPIVTPVCPPGKTPGDVVSAMYSGHCGEAGSTVSSQFTPAAIANQFAVPGAYLFAVGTLNSNSQRLGARYVVVLQTPALSQEGSIREPLILSVSSQGIMGFTDGCFKDARGFLHDATSGMFAPDGYVLPPKDGAIHQPLPATYGPGVTTGVASVDRAVSTILSGKPLTDDSFHWVLEPCSTNPPAIGVTPVCPTGAPDGTPVGRILIGGCEPSVLPRAANRTFGLPGPVVGGLEPRLYAVTRTAPADLLDGKYVAIVVDATRLAFSPWYVGIDDEGIVSIFTGACRSNAVEWAAQQPGFLLPPTAS